MGALRVKSRAVSPSPLALNRGAGEARVTAIARTPSGLTAILSTQRLFDEPTMMRLNALAEPAAARETQATPVGVEEDVVVFRLGGERYGLYAAAVEAVARPAADLVAPPNAPPFLKGVMSHRGEAIPVVDVRARFGAPPTAAAGVVIFVRRGAVAAGLLVDAVERVDHLPRSKLDRGPSLAGDAGELFARVSTADLEGGLLLIVDADALLGLARRDLSTWAAGRRRQGALMIWLLIADDSALMRRLFTETFAAEGDFETAVARDGVEALERLGAFRPDVIILDVHMPKLDGIACLNRIMIERPTPVVMVSALTQEGAEETIRALELGAVDVVAKPSGALSLKMDSFGPQLVHAVRTAAAARMSWARRLAERVRSRYNPINQAPPRPRPAAVRSEASQRRASNAEGVVVIGCSTGGPAALDAVLSGLPAEFPWPVVVAQHMPAAFTGALARRLDALSPLTVKEVTRATPLQPGEVYIGHGDADLLVAERPGGLAAITAPLSAEFRWHPSVDRLMESVMAHATPTRIVGVLMTGMGNDGAAAMTRLRAAGGGTIAEAELTAVVWGMPGELVKAGGAECVEPLDRIAGRLVEMVYAA